MIETLTALDERANDISLLWAHLERMDVPEEHIHEDPVRDDGGRPATVRVDATCGGMTQPMRRLWRSPCVG